MIISVNKYKFKIKTQINKNHTFIVACICRTMFIDTIMNILM